MNCFQQCIFASYAIGSLFVSAATSAAPPQANTQTSQSSQATTALGAAAFKPIDCVVEFGKFTAVAVPSFGGVIVDNDAYGTYGTYDSGASQPTTVALVNGKVAGSIAVALPGHAPNNPNVTQPPKTVSVEISKSTSQKLTLTWSVDATTFHAPVISCSNHLWTASSGKSAIMLRAGN